MPNPCLYEGDNEELFLGRFNDKEEEEEEKSEARLNGGMGVGIWVGKGYDEYLK